MKYSIMRKRLKFNLNGAGFTFLLLLLMSLIGCEVTDYQELDNTNNMEGVLKSKPVVPEYPGSSDFDANAIITNTYLAFEVGRVFYYEGETEDGLEEVVVTVTDEIKTIIDVNTRVVRSLEYLDGELVEKTDDWFAEDSDGNVWYFGEYSEAYENGTVDTEGSWIADGEDSMPGIIMLANPRAGVKYQQEDAEEIAEDMGMVINLNKTVSIDYGTFEGCLETMDWTPLEPGEREHKFYCPGIGLVMELQPKGGRVTIELVSIVPEP